MRLKMSSNNYDFIDCDILIMNCIMTTVKKVAEL